MLKSIIKTPTPIIQYLGLISLQIQAAKGAAMIPPKINPKTGSKLSSFTKNKNVLALA
jgi:hypothetical protein